MRAHCRLSDSVTLVNDTTAPTHAVSLTAFRDRRYDSADSLVRNWIVSLEIIFSMNPVKTALLWLVGGSKRQGCVNDILNASPVMLQQVVSKTVV